MHAYACRSEYVMHAHTKHKWAYMHTQYTSEHACIHIHKWAYACIYIQKWACMHTFPRRHGREILLGMPLPVCMYVCMYACTYACMCVGMFICVYGRQEISACSSEVVTWEIIDRHSLIIFLRIAHYIVEYTYIHTYILGSPQPYYPNVIVVTSDDWMNKDPLAYSHYIVV